MESQKYKFNCIPLEVYAELRDYCKEHEYKITHTPVKNSLSGINCVVTIQERNLPELFVKTKEFKAWYQSNLWLRQCISF